MGLVPLRHLILQRAGLDNGVVKPLALQCQSIYSSFPIIAVRHGTAALKNQAHKGMCFCIRKSQRLLCFICFEHFLRNEIGAGLARVGTVLAAQAPRILPCRSAFTMTGGTRSTDQMAVGAQSPCLCKTC
ncbi:hypothetical protein KIL84_023364 [Mauremys mutica]|uniref:Uncharacterized protein n=1 Tax=Mauremys mutica TaxID=74926 RepID=A0A9D3WSB5_9SAUR|nr:hypothetical protein KIL84_023364 [Mauremys mutica]